MDYAILLMGKNFIIYALFVVVFPGLVVRLCFPEKKKTRWFMVAYLLGCFVVINIVYVLAFLKIYNKYTFLTGYFATLGGLVVWRRRETLKGLWIKANQLRNSWRHGTLSYKLLDKEVSSKIIEWVKKRGKIRITTVIEILLLCIIIAIFFDAVSYRSITFSSFSAPDEEVHLQWVQSLLLNKVFHSGIYPFGMHNIVSAISLIGNITAVEVVKYFGVLTNIWMLLAVYSIMKELHENRWAVLLGLATVFITNMFPGSSISRFIFPVPHETSLIFVYMVGFFLILYLKENKKRYLVYFGGAFATTILFHFHATIMAGIVCVCIGIIFFVYAWKRKQVAKIFLCGFLSVCIGAWPVGAGLLQGYEFEQSMAWAVSVIDGTIEEDKDDDEYEVEEHDWLFSELATENFKHHSYEELGYINETECGYGNKGDVQFAIVWNVYVIALIFACCRAIVDRFNVQVKARFVYYLMYFVVYTMMVSDVIGIPILLYPTRLISYVPYFTAFVMAAVFEELYCLFRNRAVMKRIVLYGTVAMIGLLFVMISIYPDILRVKHATAYYFQPKGTSQAVARIINTYENRKWTVVSTVTENSIVYREGYHYEWIDFMKSLEKGKDIYIPTEYVFFVIEKKPIILYGSYFTADNPIYTQRKDLVLEDAYKELVTGNVYVSQRNVIMARAMLWAQTFKAQYPREMDVYYEDSEVIVYRLKQNDRYNNLCVKYEGM